MEWKFKPMSETIKLWLYIAIPGILAVTISVTSVYAIFKVAKVWINLYVCALLLGMGVISLYQGLSDKGNRKYRPKMMGFWAFLAGFNKGVGGGGYGPVVTIGGLLSGVPAKSMMAVTAISEGTVSTYSIIIWLLMLSGGVDHRLHSAALDDDRNHPLRGRGPLGDAGASRRKSGSSWCRPTA